MTIKLVDKLERTQSLSLDEWETLIGAVHHEDVRTYLFERARALRDREYGRNVYIRGLIEVSNYCKNDCYYCGIRKSNHEAQRYRLLKDDILLCCDYGYEQGFRTFVLQGGEDPYYTDEILVDIVASIRDQYADCAITLSMGERSNESYQRLFNAGANRYLLRHETACPHHYAQLHPRSMLSEHRKQCLYDLRAIGYQVGSGFMVGSPGQTEHHLAQDMCFLARLQPHMVGIGPFIPHRCTPYAHEPAGTLELTLGMLACLRLMLPQALLPATTALGTIDPRGREKGMNAGANVVMPNVSPLSHRRDYDLYDNKLSTGEEAAEGLARLRASMLRAGYQVVVDRGDSRVPVRG